MRTHELTDGNLLRKMALRASRVFPVIVVVLADPEKLSDEKANGAHKHGGEPLQAVTHEGVWVDTDDREQDGYTSGPYDCVESDSRKVVSDDAVEPRNVRRVFSVHDVANLNEQTGE